MSFIIRSVDYKDYESLHYLAQQHSLFNLPIDKVLLKQKIKLSMDSFAQKGLTQNYQFIFVITNPKGKVIGSSQLFSQCGTKNNPRYSMKLHKNNHNPFLQLKIDTNGPSYLGGLILNKDYQGHPDKLGSQISFIRFLFIKMNRIYFKKTIQSDLEPWLDKENSNPFFKHFAVPSGISSKEVANYLTVTNKEKLFAHFPRSRVFLSSLPKQVKSSIGRTSADSQKAYALLKKQNFQVIDEMDPLDAGPYVEAQINHIPVVKNTKKAIIGLQATCKSNKYWLVGKMEQSCFKGALLKGDLDNKFLMLDTKTADSTWHKGEEVFICPWQRGKEAKTRAKGQKKQGQKGEQRAKKARAKNQ